jgi:magnesium transporter
MDPQTSPQDLPIDVIIDEPFVDSDDILRGERRSILHTSELESTHSVPHSLEKRSAESPMSSSIASSNSVRLAGGRFGTLATRLERAITRWARTNWGDSSSSITSSNSSETSHSSFLTRSKSKRSRRKRHPPSLADTIQREQSERAVAARLRAREIGRMIPREFNLYSPPLSDAGHIEEEEQRSVRAFSLEAILPQLEHICRKPGKRHRRPGHHSHPPRTVLDQLHHPHRHHNLEARSAPRTDTIEVPSLKAEKGKGKDKISYARPTPNPLQSASTSRRDPGEEKPAQAWWLDVASPSWEDMRTLGKASSSLSLLLMVKLIRGTAVAHSPIDPGGHPTPGIARKTRVVFKARLLFYRLSCHRILGSARAV